MNRYDKYKPTNIEWIGEIPEHWEVKKLKHLTYLKARVGWHGLKADEFSLNENLPYCVTGTDFNSGIINWETCYHISEERYNEDSYIQLKEKDLLVTKDGTIGKVAVVKRLQGRAILNSGVFVMRPINEQYNSEFMYWLIQSESFNEFTRYTSKGSTIIHLYQDTFLNWSIALPFYKEQSTIANYLDEKTAQIDKLIANKQQLIELLKEERTALINGVVSGEGKNWERKKLKYVSKKVQTGSTPPSNEQQYYFEEINWFTPSDFSENLLLQISRRKIAELAVTAGVVKMFPANSVLFVGIGATLGKVGYITEPATSNQQINCLSFRFEEEAIFYANYFYSNQPNITALANAATLSILNQSQMKEILLPVPPSLDELKDVVKQIQTETQRIDIIVSKIESEMELMQEYRTSLISEVVTGKQKVTDVAISIFIPSKQVALAAEIMSQLYEENTFGRVKLQKILYLCEYAGQLEGIESNYLKAAAGPLDDNLLTTIEKQLRQLQWFDTNSSPSAKFKERITYTAILKQNDYQKWYQKYWEDKDKDIQRIIGMLRFASTEKCEMIATLFAAWNDLIIKGYSLTDDNLIIEEVFEWHKKKKRFTKEQWQKELSFMRKQKLIPKGFGKLTLPNAA